MKLEIGKHDWRPIVDVTVLGSARRCASNRED